MHNYSSPLYLVIHILLHTLTQAIMHTYVTLEPQTDENFLTKAGAQKRAAELGVAIVMPDTSPRGCLLYTSPSPRDGT